MASSFWLQASRYPLDERDRLLPLATAVPPIALHAAGSHELGARSRQLSSYGNFAASTSIFSITGGLARSSEALAISAAATLPDKCACRPASSGKASKMPKVD